MAVDYFLENNWLRSGSILARGSSSGLDTYDVGLGPFQNWTKSEHEGMSSWFLPSDFLRISQNDFYVPQSQIGCEKSAIFKELPDGEEIHGNWEAPSFEDFRTQFELALQLIESGDILKVVPVVFEKLPIKLGERHVAKLIAAGLESTSSGYFFGHWDLDRSHAVFGFTPELLFDLDEYGKLTTMALAGTAKDEKHDLLADPKERSEHQLVVDAIANRLRPFGAVGISETYPWKPSALTHLRTDIHAHVGTSSHFNILADLHPTPALGGEPKRQSKELLRKFSKDIPRFSFGAPFGVVDDIGSARVVVQIRCLIYRTGCLYLGSGCGLVKGSQLNKEWTELQMKRDSVKTIFGLL